MKKTFLVLLFTALYLTGCNQEKRKFNSYLPRTPVTDSPLESPDTEPPITTPPEQDTELNLCSKLDLSDVVWPSTLSVAEWTYYAIALNITGSFEGNNGWSNISGNFDGQGISLGLMQQNLGQGTLQPLLIQMYQQHNTNMVLNFNTQDYNSLKKMLEEYQSGPIAPANFTEFEPDLFPATEAFNKLDQGFQEPLRQNSIQTDRSVTWAQNNVLDSRGNITARWKKSFQDMAVSAGYRSFQLEASTAIYFKAKQYFEYFKFRELRFLLFLFDIVVQNGSINSNHLKLYEMWLRNNPNASEQGRALALLDARLTTVKPQYVEDVRSRKSTIIYGTGTVHQSRRDLPREYCFDKNSIAH